MNPLHLFLGTAFDNVMDCQRKGRMHEQKKTHCPSGHAYEGQNLIVYNSMRYCRACRKEYDRKYRERKRRRAAEIARERKDMA